MPPLRSREEDGGRANAVVRTALADAAIGRNDEPAWRDVKAGRSVQRLTIGSPSAQGFEIELDSGRPAP
jgi:hypothetical protein